MKSFVFPLLALAGLTSAYGQAAKPGSISPVLFEATITTENPPTTTNGWITLPTAPGFGIELDEAKITNTEVLRAK